FGFAVGGQTHHFVFAGVDAEAEMIGKSGIEESERMREMLLGQHFDAIAGAAADAAGGPLADTVDGENGCLIKRRWKKCRGGVRLVMFRKENLSVEMELVADDLFDPHFAFDPDRHRFEEGSETARRAGE